MKLFLDNSFSYTESYNVYDEDNNIRYKILPEIKGLEKEIKIVDSDNSDVALLKRRLFSPLPSFEVTVRGEKGYVEERFGFNNPKFTVDFFGLRAEGDFAKPDYYFYEECCWAANVTVKNELLVLDYSDPRNEEAILALMVAIHAALSDNAEIN